MIQFVYRFWWKPHIRHHAQKSAALYPSLNAKPIAHLYTQFLIYLLFNIISAHTPNSMVLVCFLVGNSLASEFYMPTFRNTLFHLHRRIGMKAYKIQKLQNCPEESIQHSEQSESLKSRIQNTFRVCKSVHHHTFNWINQPDAATSQVYYLSFK